MNTQNKNTSTIKIQSERLTWINPESGENYHAGIAFYDDKNQEYRLILDGPKTSYFLKAYELDGDSVRYRVYYPIFIKGKFSHRAEMGYGYSNDQTGGDIYITIGRFGLMRLLLSKIKVQEAC